MLIRVAVVVVGGLSLAGCAIQPFQTVRAVELAPDSGRRRFQIECKEDERRCLAKANELCPNGFEQEQTQQNKRYRADRPVDPNISRSDYDLVIGCETLAGEKLPAPKERDPW